ncbi:MAG: hypothetical protein ACFB51_04820, partial [Anaerolineae bacterium]
MTQLSDEEALELFRTIADFVNAPAWDASRRVYDANPVLAEPVALEAIDGMIAATLEEGDQQKARLLAVHKDLLTLSARIGPDEAFEQIATPADAQLLQTIADFVNAANWEESRAILDAHPELLGPQASATFEALIRTAENTNDTKRAQLLTAHRDLLIRVNAVGADEAFAEIEQPFDPELLETIAQFVYAGSTEASRSVLDAHPELLDAQTDAIIDRLLDDAQREGDSELAVLLPIHRDL